jgi:hypothetical protein
MSCHKHGYTNNVVCPSCDLETIERLSLPMTLYSLKRNCAMWQCILADSGLVQFQSLSRKRCLEWIEANTINNQNQ